MPEQEKRWKVVATYTNAIDTFYINELYQLDRRIEDGPSWDTLEGITITYRYFDPDAEFYREEDA